MSSGPGGQSGFGGMQHHHGPFAGGNVQSGQASLSLGGSSMNQPQRKAFTGKVTKLLDNFGFVDNDVFFQLSVVRGERKPRVGDTVYIECQYGEHMPFKWNATCVQVMDGSSAIPPSTAASIVSSSSVSPTNTSSSVKALVSTYFSSSHGNADLRQDPRVGSSTGSGVGYGFGPGNQSVSSSNDHERDAMTVGNAGGPFASRNPSFHSEYQLSEANGHRVGFQTTEAVSGAAFGSQPASYSSRGAPNQITYTSTPGSAFVQPFIDPMLLQQSAVGGPVIPPASGTSREGPFGQTPVSQGSSQPRASRWEPKSTSSKEEPRASEASKADDRKRNHSAERDRAARPGKDRYGRDLPERNEREKNRNDRARNRSTESPPALAPHSDNVPKHKLFRDNLSAQDIRRFYGMKVRVPSDFEVLLVNNHLSLDINAIPKPIKYKFHDVKKDKKREEKDSRDSKEKRKESEPPELEQKSNNQEKSQNAGEEVPENSAGGENDTTMSIEKEEQEETKPIPKEEVNDIKEGVKPKPHRKFSAKVILLSLPSMKELFEKVLGYDFERQTYTGYTAYLSRVITFLSCKNSNNGYSLIGGRFVEESDGFLPESDQPNLINTAVRCVREQTGLDLSPCSKWISVGTFVYNRNDTLGNAAVYEYTTVFLPDVWSLFEAENKTSNQTKTEEIKTEELKIEKTEEKETSNVIGKDDTVLDSLSCEDTTQEEVPASLPSDGNSELLSRINDLKVADLKNELSTRGIEFPRNAKKADLVVLLKESLSATPSSQHDSQEQVPVPSQTAIETEPNVALKEEAVEEDIQNLQSVKRPASDDHQSDTPPKKTKTTESLKKVKISGSTIELLEYIPLTTTTLYQALMHHKNDHFELSVTAELLREAIIRHLAYFIASCLQANSSNIKAAEKSANEARKKPPTLVHLYFSFFDERHMGYVWAEDILELLNCVGFRFSRKTWSALTSDLDKLHYRTLEPPTATISYTLPKHPLESSSQSERPSSVFTKNGVVYDICNLIEQSEQYSKSQVVVKDLQSVIVEKAKLLADYEMKQKKMASAIDKQNDEICDLKREREEQKKKNDDLKKLLEGALSTLNQGLKIVKDKEAHEKDKEKA